MGLYLGFKCYFSDSNGERQESDDYITVPTSRPIIRLAYNGESFFSVDSHPELNAGGLRCAFDGEILGGYSLASSIPKLSLSRQTFVAQMSLSRRSFSTVSGPSGKKEATHSEVRRAILF